MPGLVFFISNSHHYYPSTLNFELVVGCRSLSLIVVVEIIPRVVDDQSRYGTYGSILGGIPYGGRARLNFGGTFIKHITPSMCVYLRHFILHPPINNKQLPVQKEGGGGIRYNILITTAACRVQVQRWHQYHTILHS